MEDRRAFARVDCDIEATLELEGEGFPSTITGLSFKGALINTAASPRKGDKVAISFSAPQAGQEAPLRFAGRVVRAEHRGLGLEFEGLDTETLGRLRDVIAAHSDEPQAIREEFARFLEGGADPASV
jgi:hypothetical protein